MSRILHAYTVRFEDRLRELGARRIDQALQYLLPTHEPSSQPPRQDRLRQLMALDLRLLKAVKTLRRHRTGQSHPAAVPPSIPVFLCDSGLGGLARWLRACGYEADWKPDYNDTVALAQAARSGAVFLTTDGPILERRAVRLHTVRVFWIPPILAIPDQLALVREEFDLVLRSPRCMACGGELSHVDARTVWDRIPPRTRLWLTEYFECLRCRQLFWHGTHWRRIQTTIKRDR